MDGPGRADRRQVRRLAEGRARDRDQHGPLCGARVGDAGDRADVAGEAAGRSRRRALARRRPQPRPRRPPAQPEDDAADRGVGDRLRRVRLLRAGLPEPRPDDDAAPADRPAAGDRPPAERLAGAGGAARGARLRGARHLRRRRQLPARLPGRDRHRARWSRNCAPSATPTAPSALALATAKRWGDGRVGLAGGAAGRRRRRRGGPAKGGRCPGRRTRQLPATTREGAAAVYVPSCTNRIFGGGPVEALVAVSARAGLPVWIPADVAGSCCGLPWSSKGLRRRPPPQGERAGRAALGVERRGRAADRRRRRLLHRPDRRTGGGDAERGERRAPRGADDPRLGRLGPRPPAAGPRGDPQARRGGDPPDLRDPPPRPRPPPRRPRRGARRRRLRPADGDLLRLRRRPRHLPPRADRVAPPAPRRPSSPAATSTPTSRATAPARSACPAPPASDYESVINALERATRRAERAHRVGGPKLQSGFRLRPVDRACWRSPGRRCRAAAPGRWLRAPSRLSSSGLIRPRKAE